MNNYEIVYILNPVLSEEQVKESMDRFKGLLSSHSAECVFEDLWGLRKMKYSIQNRKTGFYILFEYRANPTSISDLEIELKRDERIMRFLTVRLDKHAVAFAEKRRNKITANKK